MIKKWTSVENAFAGDKATIEWLSAQKPSTRNSYKYSWTLFLEYTGMTGDQILEDRRQDTEHKWERKVLAFKQWVIDEKKKAEYTATAAAMTVRGFFDFHYQTLKYRRAEGERLGERTRKTEDYRFTREDLKQMYDFADLTEKYVVTAGKSFGLRAGDFLKRTRGDMEAYLDRESPISIGEIPTGKEKVPAYPFIDADALPVIKLKIQEMDLQGRTKPTDRILVYKREKELTKIIKRLVKKAGINIGNKTARFHCLRKYLTDRLSSYMSESKWKQVVGKAIPEKAYVSPDELRKDYIRAMGDTCWTGMEAMSDLDKREQMAKQILVTLGFGDIVEKYRMIESQEERVDALETEVQKHFRPQDRTELNGGSTQRIVAEEELSEYLSKGWKVQAVLPSGKVVVEKNGI